MSTLTLYRFKELDSDKLNKPVTFTVLENGAPKPDDPVEAYFKLIKVSGSEAFSTDLTSDRLVWDTDQKKFYLTLHNEDLAFVTRTTEFTYELYAVWSNDVAELLANDTAVVEVVV